MLSAGLAEELGVPHAIGDLMVGLIHDSTSLAERIKTLVRSMRDAFGALFFSAFGLAINPTDVVAVAVPIAVAAAMTVGLNLASGAIAARLHRLDRAAAGANWARGGDPRRVRARAGAPRDRRGPRIAGFVAGYVLVLAIIGPLAASRSSWIAAPLRRAQVARAGTAAVTDG